VSRRFEQLAWHETAMGAISLRRRLEPSRQVDLYEVKLGDEFLMSSLFTVAEIELARLGLAALGTVEAGGPGSGAVGDEGFDVVVGGLGLGYTARTVLEDPRVGSLVVVEAVAEVIDWHERRLLPDVEGLATDPRTRFVHGDFFALARGDDDAAPVFEGFDPSQPNRRFHAILLDVDHSPLHVLHPSHAAFYTSSGLRQLARHLRPGGVFALWSDDPPEPDFLEALRTVFVEVRAHVVTFPNFLIGDESSNTVYVAR
jgi:SAM-dependent methyltransferase